MTTIVATTPINKYNHSRVYKIYSTKPELNNQCYIGSTTQKLSYRFSGHRRDSRGTKSKATVHELMRQYGLDAFRIELLEAVNCGNKEELRVYENKWIKQLNTVVNGWNCQYAVFNEENERQQKKQYRETNKEKIKQYEKRYRLNNKDRIKQKKHTYYQNNKGKFKCESCNTAYGSTRDLNRHKLSQCHKNNLPN